MELLKLLFHHDLSLSQDSGTEAADLLALFSKPSPIYSFFRVSCTHASETTKFGLNHFSEAKKLLAELKTKAIVPSEFSFDDAKVWSGIEPTNLSIPESYKSLSPAIEQALEQGNIVCFSLPINGGFDLCLLSKKNIYETLFYALKTFIGEEKRLFSMNGKRISNDTLFFFELLPNGRLPHGIEEVTERINY